MSEIALYEAQKKKMEGLCDEHNLVYRFQKEAYPPQFTITPIHGMDAQICMLESMDEGDSYTSPDAQMTWIFRDGVLETRVSGGTFTISKALRTKIESILTKMLNYWFEYFFRDVMEKGSIKYGMMPVISEDEDEEPEELDEPEEEPAEEVEAAEPAGDDFTEMDENGDIPADDELYEKAVQVVRMENKATVALLQRRLNIGFARSARLMEMLEDNGIVGPFNGSDPREVLPTDEPSDAEPQDSCD